MRCGILRRGLLAQSILAVSVATAAMGQEGTPDPATKEQPEAAAEAATDAESSVDDLSRRATDPTDSPTTFKLLSDFTTDYYDFDDGSSPDGTRTELKLQPVLPFTAWGQAQILRITVPYQAGGPGDDGLGDVTIFDLAVLPQSWGRLGVGIVGNLTSSAVDTTAHAAGGPAIGFVMPVSQKLNVGLFNQNLFGDEVGISQLQPIFAYQLGNGWSLSLGDLQIVYDWERSELVSLPFGVQLGKVLPVAGQPMRFGINPQYQFEDFPGGDRFSVTLEVSVLVPGGG